jgi:tetratricopeptide (TPR) repeat protein
MKQIPLLAIILCVSFLAKGLVTQADEFELFDKPPVVRSSKETPQKPLDLKKAEKMYQTKPLTYPAIKNYVLALIESRKMNLAKEILWKHIDRLKAEDIHILTNIHLAQKENDLALKAITLQTSKDEKDYIAFALLGKIRLALKNEKLAIEAFNTSIQIRPEYENAYLPLLDHYKLKKNNYEARIILQDMLKNIGRKAPYLTMLCQINLDDKTFQQALTVCKEAAQLDPQNGLNQTNVGLALYYTEDEATALKKLKAAADRFALADYSQVQFALVLQGKKDYLNALKYFKRGAAANEKSAPAWLGIALNSFEILKYDEALAAFKKACLLDKSTGPSFRKAMITLRNAKNSQWTALYEQASDQCVFGN